MADPHDKGGASAGGDGGSTGPSGEAPAANTAAPPPRAPPTLVDGSSTPHTQASTADPYGTSDGGDSIANTAPATQTTTTPTNRRPPDNEHRTPPTPPDFDECPAPKPGGGTCRALRAPPGAPCDDPDCPSRRVPTAGAGAAAPPAGTAAAAPAGAAPAPPSGPSARPRRQASRRK